MPWDDQIEAGFPAPDADEPESLRQDILDEVIDHIACAMNRELLQDGDANNARRRMLARFGDPLKIVRRLWFDAMKERLMSKRLSVVAILCLAVACVVVSGFVWSMAQQMQLANAEAQQASLKLLQQGEITNRELMKQNQAMLQQLEKLAQREDEPPASLDWNPYQVKVVKNDKDQTPAEGCSVTLTGHAHTASEQVALHETTNAAGIAEFGLVQPGSYRVSVTTPWNELRNFSSMVKPGQKHQDLVVCPAQDAAEVEVDIKVLWPELIPPDPNLALAVQVNRTDSTDVGNKRWNSNRTTYLLIKRTGELVSYRATSNPASGGMTMMSGADPVDELRVHGEPTLIDSLKLNGTNFRLSSVHVVRLKDGQWPQDGNVPRLAPCSDIFKHTLMNGRYKIDQSDAPTYEFIAKPNEKNQWAVEMYQWTVDCVLANLKVEQHPTISAGTVFAACNVFFLSDKDHDLELSEFECLESEVRHRIKFGAFPVSFDKFITTYAEMRESGARQPVGAGSRGGTQN